VKLWGFTTTATITTSGTVLSTAAAVSSTGTLTWDGVGNILSMNTAPFSGTQGQCLYVPNGDVYGQPLRTYINTVLNSGTVVANDVFCGNLGSSGTLFIGSLTAQIGSLLFTQDDADSQTNLDITNSGGTSIYTGTIVAFTNTNTVSVTPNPPALVNQGCTIWIGHTMGRQVTTTRASSGGSTQTLAITLKDNQLTAGVNVLGYFLRVTVPRYGDEFYPTLSITGGGTVSISGAGLATDKEVIFTPISTVWEMWGWAASNESGNSPYGGAGGHYGTGVMEHVNRPVFDAVDWCAQP
jgi:hypothetical protein